MVQLLHAQQQLDQSILGFWNVVTEENMVHHVGMHHVRNENFASRFRFNKPVSLQDFRFYDVAQILSLLQTKNRQVKWIQVLFGLQLLDVDSFDYPPVH